MTTDPNNSPGSAENEDLFEFPLVGAYVSPDPNAVSEAEPAAAEATPVEQAPASAPEAAPAQEKAAAAPATAPATAPAAAPKKAAATGQADPALDEDLFDFETRFEGTQPLTTAEDAIDLGAMLDEHAATEGAAEMLVPEAAPEPFPTAAPAAPAEPAAKPASAPQASSPTPQAAPARTSVPSDIPEAMWTPPAAAPAPEGKRGRLIEVLALCFLVLTTAVVLLAWRASDDFRHTLAIVNDTVNEAVSEGHARGQQQNMANNQGTQGSMGVSPDVQAANVEPQTSTLDNPSDLVQLPRASLDLAIDRIAEGKFVIARRGLFFLLANQDRTVLNDELVVEAEALIAETYAAQAKELQQ